MGKTCAGDESQRKNQDTLERLCPWTGLGTSSDPPGRAGGGVCGSGSLGSSVPTDVSTTRPWIKKEN